MNIYQTQTAEYLDAVQEAEVQTRAERMRRFWQTLQSCLTNHPVRRPEGRPFNVLDLACGFCEESRVVGAFFSTGVPGFPSEQAQLYAVDSLPAAIQTASLLSESFDPFYYSVDFHLALRATFIHGDASQPEAYSHVPKEVDFVIIRHQIIRRDKAALEKMIKHALDRLAPDGMILLTSFAEVEHVELLKLLSTLPCSVLLEKANPHALAVKQDYPEGPVAIDKFICLIKQSR